MPHNPSIHSPNPSVHERSSRCFHCSGIVCLVPRQQSAYRLLRVRCHQLTSTAGKLLRIVRAPQDNDEGFLLNSVLESRQLVGCGHCPTRGVRLDEGRRYNAGGLSVWPPSGVKT
jgi:hypothetical protein